MPPMRTAMRVAGDPDNVEAPEADLSLEDELIQNDEIFPTDEELAMQAEIERALIHSDDLEISRSTTGNPEQREEVSDSENQELTTVDRCVH